MILRAHGAAQPLAKPGGYGDLVKEQDSGKFQRGGGREEKSGVLAIFKEGGMECEGWIPKHLWIEEGWARAGTLQRLDPEGFGGHSALGLVLGAMKAVAYSENI